MNPQPFERPSKMLIGGVLTDFFSPDSGVVTGIQAGTWSAAAMTDWDGDLDLIGGLANGGILALRDPSVGRPTGLIARPGANSVQLDWDPNWQSRIRGYYIYRANAEAGPFAKLLPDYVPLPSYLDSPVDPAIPHPYYVTGVSQFFLPGNSTSRISESLPADLAISQTGKVILSVRPARGNPGQRIKNNLSIENAVGVSGENMEVRVAYDPAKLTPLPQMHPSKDTVLSTGLSRNLTFTDNGATANGELIINGSGGSLEPGAGKMLTLQFEVGPACRRKPPSASPSAERRCAISTATRWWWKSCRRTNRKATTGSWKATSTATAW